MLMEVPEHLIRLSEMPLLNQVANGQSIMISLWRFPLDPVTNLLGGVWKGVTPCCSRVSMFL